MRLVPESKLDIEALTNLKKLNREEVLPILPELLEWTKDPNWPIASPLKSILIPFGYDLISLIQITLRNEDETWKHSLLTFFLPDFDISVIESLEDDLNRIHKNPTVSEKREGLSEEAYKLILKISL